MFVFVHSPEWLCLSKEERSGVLVESREGKTAPFAFRAWAKQMHPRTEYLIGLTGTLRDSLPPIRQWQRQAAAGDADGCTPRIDAILAPSLALGHCVGALSIGAA